MYPAVRKYIDGGDDLAEARLEEQAEAETALREMENLDPDGEEFLASFMNLRVDVLRHAEAEEQTVFPALASTVAPMSRFALASATSGPRKLLLLTRILMLLIRRRATL